MYYRNFPDGDDKDVNSIFSKANEINFKEKPFVLDYNYKTQSSSLLSKLLINGH